MSCQTTVSRSPSKPGKPKAVPHYSQCDALTNERQQSLCCVTPALIDAMGPVISTRLAESLALVGDKTGAAAVTVAVAELLETGGCCDEAVRLHIKAFQWDPQNQTAEAGMRRLGLDRGCGRMVAALLLASVEGGDSGAVDRLESTVQVLVQEVGRIRQAANPDSLDEHILESVGSQTGISSTCTGADTRSVCSGSSSRSSSASSSSSSASSLSGCSVSLLQDRSMPATQVVQTPRRPDVGPGGRWRPGFKRTVAKSKAWLPGPRGRHCSGREAEGPNQ